MLLATVFVFAACSPAGSIKLGDTGADDTAEAGDADTDADTDTDTAPVDRDGDGVTTDSDCDDQNPDVYPGADERWNERDDDCDGITDADGAWSGSMRFAASAVYEGQRYNFSLDCPYAGTRADGHVDFAITCTPDPGDEAAQRLLGATLTVTPADTAVTGDRWDDAVVFTSSNGWDSDGDGTIAWSSYDAADVEVTMSGVSLAATARGSIARE